AAVRRPDPRRRPQLQVEPALQRGGTGPRAGRRRRNRGRTASHGAIAGLLLPYRWVDALYPDPGGPALGKPELDRAGVGQVDDAVRMEGAAVVDPHYDAALIVQVGDPDITGQGQRLVRRCHAIQVVLLAV